MRVTFQSHQRHFGPRLGRLAAEQEKAQAALADGQRIRQASDDPGAMARVLKARTETAQQRQYWQNAQSALETGTAAFAGLSQIQTVGQRASELATLSTSVSAPEDFIAHAAELTQLIEQGAGAANTQYLGNYLLGGDRTDAAPFTITRDAAGEITAVAYSGVGNGTAVPLSEAEAVSPYSSSVENQQVADYLNQMIALRDALRSSSAAAVGTVLPSLLGSEVKLQSTMARMGGVQAQLQSGAEAAARRHGELQGVISENADADYATAAVRFTQSQTAYQAALQSAAKLQSRSLLDYLP